MDSNDELPEEDIRKRYSFSHRVCDDLSEIILQFLPIEDKFRFEEVSEQFQRTIFVKHYTLFLDKLLKARRLRGQTSKRDVTVMLKKLPNIRCLKQKFETIFNSKSFLNDEEIELLIENCNNLNQIDFSFTQISETNKLLFAAKFGQKVVTLATNRSLSKIIREYYPNIEELKPTVDTIVQISSFPTLLEVSELRLNKLKKVWIKVTDIQLNPTLITFVDNNRRLTDLSLQLCLRNGDAFDFVFKQISRFNNLIHLSIECPKKIPKESLENGLTLIAERCSKIKSLSLNLYLKRGLNKTAVVMNQLKHFKRLKRLSLQMFYERRIDFEAIEVIFNDSFKDNEGLTHLKLHLYGWGPIREMLFLKDFGQYLPKLQFLWIVNRFEAYSDCACFSLMRLPRLETIRLDLIDKRYNEEITRQILQFCPNIKSISL